MGPGTGVRHRRLRRPAADEAAQDPRRAARLLLPDRRRGVHAHPGARRTGLDPGPDRAAARAAGARRAAAHPVPAERGRGVRDVPADQVRGSAPVLTGGRGVADPAAGRGPDRSRKRRPGRIRAGHVPPRPAQRAGQHRRQVLRADLQRVRGQHGPPQHAGVGRRQVPPGRRRRVQDCGRPGDQDRSGGQPQPPRGRGPGDGGRGPGQAGRAGQGRRGRVHRAAGHDARRRGVRRAGRGGRDPEPVPAARLPHRRHRAHRGQQPARLHDRPGFGPVHPCTPPTWPG